MDHNVAFSVFTIPDNKVPSSLRQSSFSVAKQIIQLSGKKTLMTKLVIDFEACVDISDFDRSTPAGIKASRVVATTAPHNIAFEQTEAFSKRFFFRFESTLTKFNFIFYNLIFYRVVEIADSVFKEASTGMRRDAISVLNPTFKVQK